MKTPRGGAGDVEQRTHTRSFGSDVWGPAFVASYIRILRSIIFNNLSSLSLCFACYMGRGGRAPERFDLPLHALGLL